MEKIDFLIIYNLSKKGNSVNNYKTKSKPTETPHNDLRFSGWENSFIESWKWPLKVKVL